ncbi:hypothetical protein O9X98_04575 [Agrobacterium salinitolerans]|nr:hypothetical protein [Agrobacterium salinitolerans]
MMNAAALTFSALLCLAVVTPAAADDWHTGGSQTEWQKGLPCGNGQTCFDIHQPGVGKIGHWGTRDCWRQQIWTTIIHDVPADIDKYEITQASGRWNFGVRSVDFEGGRIVVRTFVIQDHGGPGNPCLQPGNGDFTLRFSASNE